MSEHATPLVAPPGGVMTDEVGVITGELELRSSCDGDGWVSVLVRYVGALDWYVVTGAAGVRLIDARDLGPLHTTLAAVLHRPYG